MPVQTQTPDLTDAETSTETLADPDLDTIGIELEYPVAHREANIPVANSQRSNSLREQVGRRNDIDAGEAPSGVMTGDHVGAEIVSQQMELHTTEPEVWYNNMIQFAQENGFPFSPNGRGQTNFGLHMHISDLSRDKAEWLTELCREDWFRLFVCTSMNERSADPWRHGGVGSSDMAGEYSLQRSRIVNDYGNDHYEWRLPEPMLPEHLGVVMHFLRTLEVEGTDAARDYAEDRVFSGDTRLTAVQQFQVLDERDNWREDAATSSGYTDRDVAERVIEILDEAL